MGGYAQSITDLVLESAESEPAGLSLSAVCDPNLKAHAERVATLQDRGIEVYDSFEKMLEHPGLDAVWLPVPIDLHLPFTEAALKAGKAVMLEKPVCGTIDEFDRLIRARDTANLPVLVGFQDIYDASTYPLKRHLLSGDLGELEQVSVRCCWPRTDAYFCRADWAGKIRHRGTWVLDSPVNNAMAHFVNLTLFLLGPTENSSGVPASLEAELYRAAKIENYDTASLRIQLQDGPRVQVLMTHACDKPDGPIIEIKGSRGSIYRTNGQSRVEIDGRVVQDEKINVYRRIDMLKAFARTVRGEQIDRQFLATLEVARSHTLVVNAASQAASIKTVPDDQIKVLDWDESSVRAIPHIDEIFADCAAKNQMLHESERLSFTEPASSIELTGYDSFAGIAEELRA